MPTVGRVSNHQGGQGVADPAPLAPTMGPQHPISRACRAPKAQQQLRAAAGRLPLAQVSDRVCGRCFIPHSATSVSLDWQLQVLFAAELAPPSDIRAPTCRPPITRLNMVVAVLLLAALLLYRPQCPSVMGDTTWTLTCLCVSHAREIVRHLAAHEPRAQHSLGARSARLELWQIPHNQSAIQVRQERAAAAHVALAFPLARLVTYRG